MNKIEKFLKKLSRKERLIIEKCIGDISSGKVSHLDVKRLVGREDVFRVRKGNIRIVYRKIGNNINLLLIERKSDDTYKSI